MALADAHTSTCEWGGYGTEVSSIVTTTDSSTAKTDYDGDLNTTAILGQLGDSSSSAPAAHYCSHYYFPNGATGYMGAAGEWQAALDNKDAITSALSKCGGTSMNSYYWTSTQCSSNVSWCLDWNPERLGSGNKRNRTYVRAFSTLTNVSKQPLKDKLVELESAKQDKIKVVNHGTGDTTFALTPNVYHKWGEVTSLSLTLATPSDDTVYNEYMFEFVSGATATTLTLPDTVSWFTTPSIEANKVYQVSIVNNVGLIVGV